MEKRGNVKKDLPGIFYSKICFLFTFFYTVVARSGGGMVDVRFEMSESEYSRAILPNASIRETVRHMRGVHVQHVKVC